MEHSSQALLSCKWKDWTVAGVLGSHRNNLLAAAGPLRKLQSYYSERHNKASWAPSQHRLVYTQVCAKGKAPQMLTETWPEQASILGAFGCLGSLPGLGTCLLGAEAVGAPGSLQGNTHTKRCFASLTCCCNLFLECFLFTNLFFLMPKSSVWCLASAETAE